MSATIENEDFWKQQLEKLKASGLSRAQYCRENGVNYDRFGYWITRLCPMPSSFLPVNVQTSNAAYPHATLCTLELRGHVLKIHDISALSIVLERLAQ